jgi:hypothetical protein
VRRNELSLCIQCFLEGVGRDAGSISVQSVAKECGEGCRVHQCAVCCYGVCEKE